MSSSTKIPTTPAVKPAQPASAAAATSTASRGQASSVASQAVLPVRGLKGVWTRFAAKSPELAQFAIFTGLSIAMTVLQLVLMPVAKWGFGATSLVDTSFQWLSAGTGSNGQEFFVFDYGAGSLASGGGGGLAYFLAVQITIAVAQTINFFLQRNVTFKSKTNLWRAGAWYAAAYVVITFAAAGLQGVYKRPVYDLFMNTWGMGASGEALADMTTMMINAVLSFFVFYPVLKIIFRDEKPVQASIAAA